MLTTAIRHIDHITYVTSADNEQAFLTSWQLLAFREHVRVHTRRFPAAHIALTSGAQSGQPWAIMTGLSVSRDERSPVNEFVRRYGEGQQHVAYNVGVEVDMDALHRTMAAQGTTFMTPVLTYAEGSGARLRQMFTAPTRPYGTFVELIQRLPGPDGEPFGGFDTDNIDDLYQAYADYSVWLERAAVSSSPAVGVR